MTTVESSPVAPPRRKHLQKQKSTGTIGSRRDDDNRHHHDWGSAADDVDDNNNASSCGQGETTVMSGTTRGQGEATVMSGTARGQGEATVMSGTTREGRSRTRSASRAVTSTPTSPQQQPATPSLNLNSFSEVSTADHQGWLIDNLRGGRVWCALCGDTLCIFEADDTSVSKKAIPLQGCKVRTVEQSPLFKDKPVLDNFKQKISPRDSNGEKFRFILEHHRTRQKHLFGATSKAELNHWVLALSKVCLCDPADIDTQINLNRSNGINSSSIHHHNDNATCQPPTHNLPSHNLPPHNLPPHNLPPHHLPSPILDTPSRSLSFSQPADHSKDTVVEMRRKMRKDHHELDHRSSPMKATYYVDQNIQQLARSSLDETSKSKTFFGMKSPMDILRRKKRSSSADDAGSRKKLQNPKPQDKPSSPKLQHENRANRDSTNCDESLDSSISTSPVSVTKPWDKKRHSINLGTSIRKSFSEFKDRVSNSGGVKSSESLRLRDLKSIKESGYLQCRQEYKFVKVFCVLSRGWLYGFRSERPAEVPVFSVMLNQCSVGYLMEPENRKKTLFAFKLSQTRCPSIYFCASDQQTLVKWMMSLQTEAVRVQLEKNLATELRENKASQKARQAEEIGMSPTDKDLARHVQLRMKRHSCPTFSQEELKILYDKTSAFDNMGHNSSNTECHKGNNLNNEFHEKGNNTINTSQNMHLTNNLKVEDEKYSRSSSYESNFSQELVLVYEDANPIPTLVEETPDMLDDTGTVGNKDISGNINIPSRNSVKDSPTFKPGHRRTNTAYSIEVKNMSEKLFQKAGIAVRRAASLDKMVIQRPTKFESRYPEKVTKFSACNLSVSSTERLSTSGDLYDLDDDANDVPDSGLANFADSGIEISKLDMDTKSLESWDSTMSSLWGSSHDDVPENRFRVLTSRHEPVVAGKWSTDEDFLMSVIQDRLRQRSLRGSSGRGNDVTSRSSVMVVEEDWSQMTRAVNNAAPCLPQGTEPNLAPKRQQTTLIEPTDRMEQQSGRLDGQVLNQGYLEKLGYAEKWNRYWCVLRDDCLWCYARPEDRISLEVIDLKGYEVVQLVDSFPGRRFVLKLEHKDYINVVVALESRDEMLQWYTALRSRLESLRVDKADVRDLVPSGYNDVDKRTSPVSSAQTVKEKLLAEVLRQKTELEKMQAARNSLKNMDVDYRSSSPTLGSSLGSSQGTSPTDVSDRICTLTRLKQRRMSAQIKLSVIRKEIEGAASVSPKEKKTVFGRKKPDLVIGHNNNQGHRPDLEEQALSLSSVLQALDTCITSHGVPSPGETDFTENMHKKLAPRHSAENAQVSTLATDTKHMSLYNFDSDTTKSKEKDINRTTSLKSSFQNLAHRTFAKANWSRVKKSSSPPTDKVKTSLSASTNQLSELTPDVIDMTNNNGQPNGKVSFMLDGTDIPAPPDSFRTDPRVSTSTLPSRKKHGTMLIKQPKSLESADSSLSNSLNSLESFQSRLALSASYPSLLQQSPYPSLQQSPYPSLQQSPYPSLQQSPYPSLPHQSSTGSDTSYLSKSTGRYSVTHSPRGGDQNKMALTSGKKNGLSSRAPSTKREVNPNTLAQIEAFEELSIKFLAELK